jgi:hypothetical protein
LLAIPLLVGSGVAEGLWTDRWQLSTELEQAQGKLSTLPRLLGPWDGQDQELPERVVQMAELRAYVQRRYVRRQTGDVLSVLVVCGRPGPVTVHSPAVCFPGAGFFPTGSRTREVVKAESLSPAEFWAERYRKSGAIPETLQVYYSWNPGSGWSAADRPRLAFARARALYKVYVVRQLPRADEPAERDPIPGFLRLLLPELDRCLKDAAENRGQ